jgi:hypothetical protein
VLSITRKTDKGLPRYVDEAESDTYLLSGAEDLVPHLVGDVHQRIDRGTHWGYLYRPRIEGLFARIERWVPKTTTQPEQEIFWQVTTPDNVTHVYGPSPASRIADPQYPQSGSEARVFTWLLEETRDDKGNVTRYEYVAEDGVGVDPSSPAEKSRFDYPAGAPTFLATAQKYLKRVLYGNQTAGSASGFLFEMVLDYGDHSAFPTTPPTVPLAVPPASPDQPWPVRQDAFSSYRSGFEVRTYRLCRRVLMFHHFDPTPLLVRATEFEYEPHPSFTYLTSVTQAGYLFDSDAGAWERAEMPRLDLDYQRPELNDVLSTLPEDSRDGLVGGTDGRRKQWVDLDGEGIPGVLIDEGGAWFYKENSGGGKLEAPRRLHAQPSPGALATGAQSLEDLDGDGRLELIAKQQSLQGYFTRTEDGNFDALRAFETVPNITWNDPNLRIIDLDGDGHGDILITEDEAFVWYRSRAKKGYEQSRRVAQPFDEEKGPRVVFNDREQSIQLADMSGDGLVDIVRVRNGSVCYWPNLGYGRFGRKVSLDSSPVFDTPDHFHASRVRFGDVDGSGTSDLFYLGREGTDLYWNESGNALSAPVRIRALPPVDKVSQLSVTDLLGTGTSTLVWTTPLNHPHQNVLYVDLMGSKKPHLLIQIDNNLGAVNRITYASSTKFYLEDKKAGNEWLTRLPFPVQVVEQREVEDAISGGRLVSRYRYRHGFFDGFEREFRGFARVEMEDAENFGPDDDPLLYQSPVRTISWFHTGAWLEKERLELALRDEYFPQNPPPEPITVPDNLPLEEFQGGSLVPVTDHSIQDAREAARALKGSPLRKEVYAIDGSPQEGLPYVITETNQQVRRLQPSTSTGSSSPTPAKRSTSRVNATWPIRASGTSLRSMWTSTAPSPAASAWSTVAMRALPIPSHSSSRPTPHSVKPTTPTT